MRKVLNRRNALLALIAIVVLPVTWWMSAGLRGRLTARYDVAHGRYKILTYGPILGGFTEYQQLLRERYGIEVRPVAGCVSFSAPSYVDGYDSVSMPAANHKFGRDVLKKTWDEATQSWQEKHKAELQNVSRSE